MIKSRKTINLETRLEHQEHEEDGEKKNALIVIAIYDGWEKLKVDSVDSIELSAIIRRILKKNGRNL